MPSLYERFINYWTPFRQAVTLKLKADDNAGKEQIFSSSELPDARFSLAGHSIAVAVYLGVCVAFIIVNAIQFFERPQFATSTQTLASGKPPVLVDIEVSCSNAPNCGVATLLVNYSTSSAPNCAVGTKYERDNKFLVAKDSTGTPHRFTGVPLCYVGEPGESVFSTNTKAALTVPGVTVDFSWVNPGYSKNSWGKNEANWSMHALGIVKVFPSNNNNNATAIQTVNLDSWQVKSLQLSSVHYSLGDWAKAGTTVPDPSAVPVAVQYEGKRPSWRATLIVAHTATMSLTVLDRSDGVAGGIFCIMEMSGFCFFYCLFIVPLINTCKLLQRLCPGPAAVDEEEQEKQLEKEAKEEEIKKAAAEAENF